MNKQISTAFMVIAILILLSMYGCMRARAEGYHVFGYGAQPCKQLSSDITSKDPAEREQVIGYYGWVEGYISRRESEEATASGHDFDPLPETFKAEDQVAFMAEFCVANQDAHVADAADAIFERLRALGALQGDHK